MGGEGGCRVGEVRTGTTSPMPDHKGFKLQQLVNVQKFSTVRVNGKAVYKIHDHTLFMDCVSFMSFLDPAKHAHSDSGAYGVLLSC